MMKLIFLISFLFATFSQAQVSCREIFKGVLQAEVRGTEILYLTEAEYRNLVRKKGFLAHTILVLEKLPLDVDMPVVSAIITKQPLQSAFSHPENQAEALGIPIWNSPSLFEKLQGLRKKDTEYFQISLVGSEFYVSARKGQLPLPSVPSSVLPLVYDRSIKALVEIDSPLASTRELVGDKFADLASSRYLKQSRPDFVGMTSGYFENFIDSFGIGGNSLRRLRSELIRDLKHPRLTAVQMEERLARFRDQVAKAEILTGTKPALQELLSALQARFPGVKDFSFRSSTDIEGVLNTAGLFSSFRLQLESAQSLERLFRDVLTAMYSARSFQIRQRMGILENNLSMPMMVHPYIHPVLAHGIARIEQTKEGYLGDMRFSLVLGADEKATNPSAEAQVLKFDAKSTSEAASGSLIKATQEFFKNESFEIRMAMRDRLFGKGQSEFEFVLLPAENGPQIMILQAAVPLSLEATASVLKGTLSKAKAFTPKKDFKVETIEDFRKFNRFKSLKEMIENPKLFQTNGHRGPRFALIQKDDQPAEFIFWTDSVLHEKMIDYVRSSGFKYLADGYSSNGNLGQVSFHPPAFGVMYGQNWIQYRAMFVEAIQRETAHFFARQGATRSWDSVKSFAIYFNSSGTPGSSESFVWSPN